MASEFQRTGGGMRHVSPYLPNPQAMRDVSKRRAPEGHPDLLKVVDPDTWLTPRYILSEIGTFDLDPCAAESNPFWTGTTAVMTKAEDGLRQIWHGRVFMNPPFSNTVPWLEKHAEHGLGISLVPATLESGVWRKTVWPKAKCILLLAGRVRFCNPDGSNTTGRPLRPVSLIAWSDEDEFVLRRCALAGVLLSQWKLR